MSYFRTGFLYDEFFTKHKNPWAPGFVERPERVSDTYKRCCELGLVDRCTRVQVLNGPRRDKTCLQRF